MNNKGTDGAGRVMPGNPNAEEPPVSSGEELAQDPETVISNLQEQLRAQGARLDEVLRAYSRSQQDREDFRKRSERERERVLEAERGKVALALIEAVDELDRTLSSVPAPNERDALVAGVRLIRDGLLRRLLALGIERYDAAGDAFNPTLHEASDTLEVEDPKLEGRVVEDVRAGYRQGERVLRAARVRVGRYGKANMGE
jgi:molecular chaperone GrpE